MNRATTYLKEVVRCTRHNFLHLKTFRLGYDGGNVWRVSDGNLKMSFPRYPYLDFYDIEGYLNEGRWKPEPGMTVIDAGGCYGEFSLYASKRVGPTGRVLMLEPDPANIAMARRVFELNGNPANIEIVPAGLWNTRGTLRFTAGDGPQSQIATDASPHTGATIEIPTHSLPSLAQTYDLKRLDFVKMDIEGAELQAMSVADQLPPHLRPRYAIASYHVVDGQKTAGALAELFPKLGYHSKSGYPNHLTTYATPLASDL